jgi:hypothetical protein
MLGLSQPGEYHQTHIEVKIGQLIILGGLHESQIHNKFIDLITITVVCLASHPQ